MSVFVTLISGCILQIIFLKYISYQGITVNILLLLTVEIALVNGSSMGQKFGFLSGLIEDFFSLGLLGERTVIRTILGYFVGKLKGKFSVSNVFFQIFIVFTVYMIHSYFIYVMRLMFLSPVPALRYAFFGSLINAALAPLAYRLVKRTSAG